jgi:hypothetical protein
MAPRIPRDWLVHRSIENAQHDRCVDLFQRPDGSHGFEAFRRDVEDGGAWTPTGYYSGAVFESPAAALAAARKAIAWLADD